MPTDLLCAATNYASQAAARREINSYDYAKRTACQSGKCLKCGWWHIYYKTPFGGVKTL